MKILITGKDGQLGKELVLQLEGTVELVALEKKDLDITSYDDVYTSLMLHKPDVVINCAAFTNVDECEKNESTAFKVNTIGAKNLAIGSYLIGSKILHISTDYVFGGVAEKPYREYDQTRPSTVYGQSKLCGEKAVILHNPQHFIIRTAWLYGDGHNFVNTMLNLASTHDELNVVDDQIGSPTSTTELANVIIKLIYTDHYGVYHGTCEGSCSWFDFANKIFEINNIDIKVNRISSNQIDRLAPRPLYSVLDNFMLTLIGLNDFSNWEESLANYFKMR